MEADDNDAQEEIRHQQHTAPHGPGVPGRPAGLAGQENATVYSTGPAAPAPHELAALVQHAIWILRWTDLLPVKITGPAAPASAASPPLLQSPAVGLALLESAVKPYIAPVVDTCLGGASVPPYPLRVPDLGGGYGAYARELASRGCATTLQDLPAVITALRETGVTQDLKEHSVQIVAADAFDRLADGPVGAAFGVQMLVATDEGTPTAGLTIVQSAGKPVTLPCASWRWGAQHWALFSLPGECVTAQRP